MKTLLTLFLISIQLTVFSQTNPLNLDNGSLWRVNVTDEDVCTRQTYFHNYQISGDTLYNGLLYQKLYSDGYVEIVQKGMPGCLPSSFYQANFGLTLRAFLRQDILTSQVFMLDTISGTDSLIYDFSLAVGDTILSALNYLNEDLVVDSVSYVVLGDNLPHKHLWYHAVQGITSGALIEGVGSTNGILQPFSIFEDFYRLDCYSYNNIPVYAAPTFMGPCEPAFNITDNSGRLKLKMSPNPANDKVQLTFESSGNRTVTVYDLSGRVFDNFQSSGINYELAVDHLPVGLYYVKVEEGDSFNIAKLVKN